MKHSVKHCLKRGDTFLSHFDEIKGRHLIDRSPAFEVCQNAHLFRTLAGAPVNHLSRYVITSGAAKSLFILDWCFLGLGIYKIEIREEGVQVGVVQASRSNAKKSLLPFTLL